MIARTRPGGEIGRHARLKISCRKACGFDSRPGHQEKELDSSQFFFLVKGIEKVDCYFDVRKNSDNLY